MSVIQSDLLLGAPAGATAYTIQRSLRFNPSDSAHCTRTVSTAGNRRTWTFSAWVKRSQSASGIPYPTVLGAFDVARDIVRFIDDAIQVAFDNGVAASVTTSTVYRDYCAWYHVVIAVDTTQATSASRIKIYVNGLQQATSGTFPSQNYQTIYINNTASTQTIGTDGLIGTTYFSGYLADIHFIDGQALDPTSFGEFDANNVWQPKAYTGTYGTNGFKLDFSDNSSNTATTLGKDSSGNNNNWTPVNLSVTAGAGNDSLRDSPTNGSQTDTGVGGEVSGNYATLNGIAKGTQVTLSNGNLDYSHVGNGTSCRMVSTIAMSSGKWYCEHTCTASSTLYVVGIVLFTEDPTLNYVGQTAGSYGYYALNGNKYNNASSVTYGATYGLNDVIGIAFDADNGTLTFYKNGVSQGTAYSSLPAGSYFFAQGNYTGTAYTGTFNFGARAFAYTAPSGFKALCTANLPTPAITKGSTAFDTLLWTGNGSARSITGLGFNPDLVWIKGRSGATDHALYDSVRGAEKRLESNNTDAEVTSDGGVTAFNSDGFSLGTLAQVNTNTSTYAAWCWDESVSAGFDIVTYTGNGTNRTVAHSLNVAPSLIVVKQRTAASATNWAVWHSALANTEYLLLNSTAAKATGATYWNSTSPTSSTFSLGTSADVNNNTGTYVAYLWSQIAGYSSFGSYTGNGSADGPMAFTGFRPRWVLIKSASVINGGGEWYLQDTARSTYNGETNKLYTNSSVAENSLVGETTTTNLVDFLSNGFKLRSTNLNTNQSATTYIYAAFAEHPFSLARAR